MKNIFFLIIVSLLIFGCKEDRNSNTINIPQEILILKKGQELLKENAFELKKLRELSVEASTTPYSQKDRNTIQKETTKNVKKIKDNFLKLSEYFNNSLILKELNIDFSPVTFKNNDIDDFSLISIEKAKKSIDFLDKRLSNIVSTKVLLDSVIKSSQLLESYTKEKDEQIKKMIKEVSVEKNNKIYSTNDIVLIGKEIDILQKIRQYAIRNK